MKSRDGLQRKIDPPTPLIPRNNRRFISDREKYLFRQITFKFNLKIDDASSPRLTTTTSTPLPPSPKPSMVIAHDIGPERSSDDSRALAKTSPPVPNAELLSRRMRRLNEALSNFHCAARMICIENCPATPRENSRDPWNARWKFADAEIRRLSGSNLCRRLKCVLQFFFN
ncbi:hypothetical protein GWI33_001864 [Rhynchophorus ferrugineus]|uniref:Uncharacterized protein n=1 Tax=Rhynchophorus ferrugineus TaxID=354439 RepID=A0A834MGR0_RHYFE|nr:hypothetical protein GWI33_001864 [Rhynchophorus ferrugineus]